MRGISKARSNLCSDGKQKQLLKMLCLRSHDQNLQCDRLSTPFRVPKSMLDNPLPRISGANYHSCTASQSTFKQIKGEYRGQTFSWRAMSGFDVWPGSSKFKRVMYCR